MQSIVTHHKKNSTPPPKNMNINQKHESKRRDMPSAKALKNYKNSD